MAVDRIQAAAVHQQLRHMQLDSLTAAFDAAAVAGAAAEAANHRQTDLVGLQTAARQAAYQHKKLAGADVGVVAHPVESY